MLLSLKQHISALVECSLLWSNTCMLSKRSNRCRIDRYRRYDVANLFSLFCSWKWCFLELLTLVPSKVMPILLTLLRSSPLSTSQQVNSCCCCCCCYHLTENFVVVVIPLVKNNVEETGAVPATSIDRAIQFKSKHWKQDERKEITNSLSLTITINTITLYCFSQVSSCCCSSFGAAALCGSEGTLNWSVCLSASFWCTF